MKGNYVLVRFDLQAYEDDKNDKNEIERLFRKAKLLFLRHDFAQVLALMEEAYKAAATDSRYWNAANSNLALMYHLLGRTEEAYEKYRVMRESAVKAINFYAFCHRNFLYGSVEEKAIDEAAALSGLWQHNHLNYVYAKYGAEAALKYGEAHDLTDLFSEQILNDIRNKTGRPLETKAAERMGEWAVSCLGTHKVGKIGCSDKPRIGIFVTDVQRHKEAAVIYDLVDVLSKRAEVYIYFNNIFDNKLIRSFVSKCTVRHVIQMSFSEVSDLMAEDHISVLLDLAEYGLRNNCLALKSVRGITLPISALLQETPAILTSKDYFTGQTETQRTKKAAAVGDLKCITQRELLFIKKYSDAGFEIIFESQAFDDPVYRETFEKKLSEIGYEMERVEMRQGILPFSSYLNFLASVSFVFIVNGASSVELAEAIYCKTPTLILSENGVIRRIGEKLQLDMPKDDCIVPVKVPSDVRIGGLNRAFEEKLWEYIGKMSHSVPTPFWKDEVYLLYEESGKKYYTDCTCNGDIVLFDDPTGNDGYEYIIAE